MDHTQNLGLTEFESTEKFRISQDENSLNKNMELIDEAVGELTEKSTDAETRMTAMQDAIAIVANGNTHAAIASGQFVYVKGHGSLAEGLYKATAAIAANGALSTSNLTADGAGGLNALKASVDTLNSKFTWTQIYDDTLAQGTNVDVTIPNTAHEVLVGYGSANSNQSYGGDIIHIPIGMNKPCFLPVYTSQSGTISGMVYVFLIDRTLRLQNHTVSGMGASASLGARFIVYVR